MTVQPVSLLVSGLISGRFSKNGSNLLRVTRSFKIFREIDMRNEIVISTYENEVPKELENLVDKIIINKDPGPDIYRTNPWPIGQDERRNLDNITRLFTTTYEGVKACKNEIVLKTRIEMLPAHELQFKYFYNRIQDSFKETNESRVGFFLEHYTGVFFAIDGQLGVIPGMVQIGSKSTLEKIWGTSLVFWQKNKEIVTRKSVRHPLSSEQVLGHVYLNLFCKLDLTRIIKKLKKYYISVKLIRSIMFAEKMNFVYFQYKESGLSNYVYPGTINIKTPEKYNKKSLLDLILQMIIILIKRPKHLVRRYYEGFREKI